MKNGYLSMVVVKNCNIHFYYINAFMYANLNSGRCADNVEKSVTTSKYGQPKKRAGLHKILDCLKTHDKINILKSCFRIKYNIIKM